MLRTLLSVSTFLLTLAACVWATVAISRGPIERDLTKRSLAALEQIDGFRPEYCDVKFVGRDGQIWGEVQSQQLKDAVEQQLQGLYGVRVIETELVVRPFDAPWILVARKDENTTRIEGLLAEDSERDGLITVLGGVLGVENTLDLQIEVRDKVEPATWLPGMVEVLGEFLPQAEEGGVAQLRDGKLSLSGELPTAEFEEAFIDGTKRLFADAGVVLDFALTIAPPPEPASFELFPPKDGEIVVAGRLGDLDAAQKLLTLLRASGNWIIKDQIVVAENTEVAPWIEPLTFLLPSVMSEVIGARIEIEGSRLRLDGQVSEDMLVAVSEVAGQNFPATEYEVQNRLRMVTPPREAMVSVLTYPGRVKLKGLLAEEELKERVVQAVRGAMDGGELFTDELQVDPNVMEANWVDSLVQLVPPYVQQVKRGGLTIYSNILAVEAVINSDSDRDLIWAMTEQFFPDDKYRRLLELRFPEEVEGGIAADDDSPGG